MKHVIRVAILAGPILGVVQFIPIGQPTTARGSSFATVASASGQRLKNSEVAQIPEPILP